MSRPNKPDWETRRRKFWGQLVAAMSTKSQLTANFSSPERRNLYRNSVLRGANYAFVVSEDEAFARVEVYIGRRDPLQNDQIFDLLEKQKAQIETVIGKKLFWQRLDGGKVSRVSYQYDGVDFLTISSRNQLVADLSDMMVKFENGFQGPLGGITI